MLFADPQSFTYLTSHCSVITGDHDRLNIVLMQGLDGSGTFRTDLIGQCNEARQFIIDQDVDNGFSFQAEYYHRSIYH